MRPARASTRFLAFLAALYSLLGAAALHAHVRSASRRAGLEAGARLVKRWGLTDLCLFTEARYTRHPSQSDLFTPFQEHPGSLEHFPSGSLAAPPRNGDYPDTRPEPAGSEAAAPEDPEALRRRADAASEAQGP